MSPRRPVRYPELGATLRRAREALDPPVSGNALAERLADHNPGHRWSQAKVSLLEAGRQQPSETDVLDWATETGTDPGELLDARERALVRRLDIREAARRPGGVEALQGDLETLEAGSRTIAEYQPTVVPGLAQTSAYTRAWLSQPGRVELGGAVDVEDIVARRRQRQQRLRDRSIVVAVQPAALTAVYGTVDVQLEQLDALAGDESLQLIVARHPLAILHGFELLDDAAIVETVAGMHVMADTSVVEQFRAAMRRLQRDGATGRQALAEVRRARDALTGQ